jgi:hypothetical protein
MIIIGMLRLLESLYKILKVSHILNPPFPTGNQGKNLLIYKQMDQQRTQQIVPCADRLTENGS